MTKSTKFVAALGIAAGLGVAALPLGTFAVTTAVTPYGTSPATQDVEVELVISNAVGIASDKAKCSTEMMPNATASCANIISIGTNDRNGMTLTVKDADAELRLVGNQATPSYIAATDGTLIAGTNGWNISGGLLSNKAITATEQNVYVGDTTSGAEERDVNMTYNFATDVDQAQGTYSDVITYTVTAN
ncbi:MAG: hypothetical protein Q4E70_01930 [Candidatus Saccharibacteria bacterium]|nr:hypothetical protein [Candidatus Saccharibacteria bacterium]